MKRLFTVLGNIGDLKQLLRPALIVFYDKCFCAFLPKDFILLDYILKGQSLPSSTPERVARHIENS